MRLAKAIGKPKKVNGQKGLFPRARGIGVQVRGKTTKPLTAV